MKKPVRILPLLLALILLFSACTDYAVPTSNRDGFIATVNDVPQFDGETPYVEINGGVPKFKDSDMTLKSYERYSPLDILGRCGVADACVGKDIMPTEERGAIGMVKPSGWHTVKYDIVDGKYLYNRCHLIGYQLTGENANEENLITGTRYLNVDGMLPFENMVADYVKDTGNHVLYRVTPVYDGLNLVARGVQMEAKSVEDNGKGVQFNVYVYNNQPGITIDYKTGESAQGDKPPSSSQTTSTESYEYVINKNTKKFHKADCGSVKDMKPQNKKVSNDSKQTLIQNGYSPCKACIK